MKQTLNHRDSNGNILSDTSLFCYNNEVILDVIDMTTPLNIGEQIIISAKLFTVDNIIHDPFERVITYFIN